MLNIRTRFHSEKASIAALAEKDNRNRYTTMTTKSRNGLKIEQDSYGDEWALVKWTGLQYVMFERINLSLEHNQLFSDFRTFAGKSERVDRVPSAGKTIATCGLKHTPHKFRIVPTKELKISRKSLAWYVVAKRNQSFLVLRECHFQYSNHLFLPAARENHSEEHPTLRSYQLEV